MTVKHATITDVYDEVELSEGLVARISPVERCGDPLCECVITPHCMIFYGDRVEDGEGPLRDADAWLSGRSFPMVEAEQILEGFASLEDAERDRWLAEVRAGAILIGVPWASFTGKRAQVFVDLQSQAWPEIPQWYSTRPVEELRRLRAAIYELNPNAVIELLRMTTFYASQTGGGRGRPG